MEIRNTTFVAIAGRKGGITKSTLAKNLAAGCALAGLRTVLVDADGQGNASSGVRVTPHDAFHSLIVGDLEFQDVLVRIPDEFTGQALDLFLLSAFNGQQAVEKHPDASTLIYERFQELRGWADVVIVDTSPGITDVHTGFYFVSDFILLPTLCEMDSILSLDTMIDFLNRAKEAGAKDGLSVAQILGIVPNRFDKSQSVHKVNVGYIRGRYDRQYHIFDPITDLAVWVQAAQVRESIYRFAHTGTWGEKRKAQRAINELKPVLDVILKRAGLEAAAS